MTTADQFVVLRHARAGKKLRDRGRDFERGLDRKGREVAGELPEAIAEYIRPEVIVSSPFRRCVETVEPLAAVLGLPIVEDEEFAAGRTAKAVRASFGDAPPGSVVCTHGEVIAQLFSGNVKCAKGAFWVVERRDGELFPVRYVAAPAAQTVRPVT